jgi:hypothetical protein
MLSIHPPGETPQELSRRYARKGGAQCLGVTRRNLPLILGGRAGTSGDAPVLTNQLADVFTGSVQTCRRISGKMSLQSSVERNVEGTIKSSTTVSVTPPSVNEGRRLSRPGHESFTLTLCLATSHCTNLRGSFL